MTELDLARLLGQAVDEAERRAPGADPLRRLDRAREDRRRRAGQLVGQLALLVLVAVVLLVQLLPAPALGAPRPGAVPVLALGDAPAPPAIPVRG